MKELIDTLVEMYTLKTRAKRLQKKEMEEFYRFFYAFTESDDKYKHIKTAGLVYIQQNEKQIFQQISEAVPSIHNRSKDYQSILSSKANGLSGRRTRRLV